MTKIDVRPSLLREVRYLGRFWPEHCRTLKDCLGVDERRVRAVVCDHVVRGVHNDRSTWLQVHAQIAGKVADLLRSRGVCAEDDIVSGVDEVEDSLRVQSTAEGCNAERSLNLSVAP